jgi:multicomponent Na+:H+ antiporter subunit C
MNVLYAASIATIMGCGIYLLLSRHIMRIIFGVALLSAGANLLIFVAGRLRSTLPPVIESGMEVLDPLAANPLPQALILTAIVIGFSLVSFVAALALRAYREMETVDTRKMGDAEAMGSPYVDPEGSDA